MATYSAGWYARIREGCQRSAAVIAPLVFSEFSPRSVVDVGCGEGWWALAFADLGAHVVGIDGAYVKGSPLGPRFCAHDITQPFPDLGTFDLAVCLEVAEHLEPAHADHLVASLTALSRNVLFSAAVPGQGGNGHVNCQWPDYWASRFAQHDYATSGALRWLIWDDEMVEPWYRQNLLFATHQPELFRDWFDGPAALPHAVIHPELQ